MGKYKIKSACTCMITALMLVGCGAAKVPEIVDVTSIVVADSGEVTSYLVDEFDKDYYDLADLTAMALQEAAQYNTQTQAGERIPLTVEKVEALSDGSNKVVVTHKYDSVDTFMNYNGSVLFYGTVTEAVDAGYSLSVTLKNVKDGTLYSEAQLLQNPDKYLLITNEKAVIYCPRKVTYVSGDAVYNEDGTVDTSQAEGRVLILMK